ncbi:MAG: hypothetical protein J6W26_00165 [Bacteroidales bacterium]|nr:hypothetical protein [Bacteroidales bacterium]
MVIIVLSIIAPLMYMGFTQCDNRVPNLFLCLLWAIVIMYVVFTRRIFSFVSTSRKIGELLCVISVILLPYEQKKALLKFITAGLAIIFAISIPPWILHLLGVPMPHSAPFLLENGFHWVTNYYFFLAGDETNLLKFPRFRGMFIEAGQAATVCVLLYFANGRKLRLWQKISLLTAIILSFSLAAYVTFMLCFALTIILNPRNRYKIISTGLLFAVVIGFFSYFNNPQHQNNAFYNLIVERLVYDEEKGIAGNNRSSEYVEYRYEQLMNSKDKYLGLGRELNSAWRTNDNWTNDSSGIRKFIIWNGLIGTALVFLYMLVLLLQHRSYGSFVIWVCVVANFLVRDLLLTPMWMIITILGVFVLHLDRLEQNEEEAVEEETKEEALVTQ